MTKTKIKTKIIKVEANVIYLNDTVAFASDENGSGDTGYIKVNSKLKIPFSNTTKIGGDYVNINGSSKVRVNYDVGHVVDPKYYSEDLVGKKVTVVIDKKNRRIIAANYSLMNVIISYLEIIRPDAKQLVNGKIVMNDKGVIEFTEQLNLTKSEEAYIRRKIKRDIVCCEEMWSFPVENNDGINLWETDNANLLCSGVHLDSCAGINQNFSIKFKTIDNKSIIYSKSGYQKPPSKFKMFLTIFLLFMFFVATIFIGDIIAISFLILIALAIFIIIMVRIFHKIF